MDTFENFIKHDAVDEEIILRYKNGFLKVVNPDEYLDILERCYNRYEQAIPIFTTSMGDIIVWEKDKYVNLLNFGKGQVQIISSGFDFFFDDLKDNDFMNEELLWEP